MRYIIKEYKLVIILSILILALLISFTTYLYINSPEKLREITIIGKVDTDDKIKDTDNKKDIAVNEKDNKNVIEDIDYAEYGNTSDNVKELKEINKLTGIVIEQPSEETEDGEENMENDEETNEINEEHPQNIGNTSFDTEDTNDGLMDNYRDELLDKPLEAVLYEIRKFINNDIKNNSYIAIMTSEKTEREFRENRGYNYSILLNNAKIKIRYIDYYDIIMGEKCNGMDDILNSWNKTASEVRKLNRLINTMESLSDVQSSKELRALKIIQEADKFTGITNKYLIGYDPYAIYIEEDGKNEDTEEDNTDENENVYVDLDTTEQSEEETKYEGE